MSHTYRGWRTDYGWCHMDDCSLQGIRQHVPYYTEDDTGQRVYMRDDGDFVCAECGGGLYTEPHPDQSYMQAALDAGIHPDDFAGTPQHQEWEARYGDRPDS